MPEQSSEQSMSFLFEEPSLARGPLALADEDSKIEQYRQLETELTRETPEVVSRQVELRGDWINFARSKAENEQPIAA